MSLDGSPWVVIISNLSARSLQSNNLVIQSMVNHFHKVHAANGDTGGHPSPVDRALPHIITCTVEHDSIRLPLEHLGEERVAGECSLATQGPCEPPVLPHLPAGLCCGATLTWPVLLPDFP